MADMTDIKIGCRCVKTNESKQIIEFLSGDKIRSLFTDIPPFSKIHENVFERMKELYNQIYEDDGFRMETNVHELQPSVMRGLGMPSVLYVYKQIYEKLADSTFNKKESNVYRLITELPDEIKQSDLQELQFQIETVYDIVRDKRYTNRLLDDDIGNIIDFWDSHRQFYEFFIPLDVQFSLERKDIDFKSVEASCIINGEEYECTIQLYTENESIDDSFFKDMFTRIFMLCALYPNSCKKTRFDIYLSQSKKNVVINRNCWTSLNINTGCTYRASCRPITIWRKQELLKTLFHEMIHSFHWDIQEDVAHINRDAAQSFSFQNDPEIKLYEAYTESWAALLNAYLCAILNCEDVDVLVERERHFLFFQVAKIVRQSGFKTITDMLSVSDGRKALFCQSTDVFSYFIIKATLYWDFDWFVENLRDVPFQMNNIAPEELWEYSKSVLESELFQDVINRIMREYKITGKRFINETMRMTANEYCF